MWARPKEVPAWQPASGGVQGARRGGGHSKSILPPYSKGSGGRWPESEGSSEKPIGTHMKGSPQQRGGNNTEREEELPASTPEVSQTRRKRLPLSQDRRVREQGRLQGPRSQSHVPVWYLLARQEGWPGGLHCVREKQQHFIPNGLSLGCLKTPSLSSQALCLLPA